MGGKSEIRDFLTARRAALTPEQVGLPNYGRRRVPGLKREEVAQLAQVSVDYYGRLERGNLKGVSESVLHALVAALRLTSDEEQHLRTLIQQTDGTIRPRKKTAPAPIRPSILRMLDAMSDLPVIIQNGRLDIVAANRLGRALYSDNYDSPAPNPSGPPNHARFIFLDPRGRDFAPDWDRAAGNIVAILRAEAGRDPFDRELTDLIGELCTRSDEFRIRWAAHNVLTHRSSTKQVHHRAVGTMTLDFEIITLETDPPLTMAVFSAEPGSPSADALTLLAGWANAPENLPSEGLTTAPSAARLLD